MLVRLAAKPSFRNTLLLTLVCSFVVSGFAGTSFAQALAPKAPPAKPGLAQFAGDAVWGEAVDGLACRVSLARAYVPGQAIAGMVEIKNVSNRARVLYPNLDPQQPKSCQLEITSPRGQKLQQTARSEGGLSLSAFQKLEPGGVRRYEFEDLRAWFNELHPIQFVQQDGRYRPQYQDWPADSPKFGRYKVRVKFTSPAVPPQFVTGEREVNGQREKIVEVTPEELKKDVWANTATSAEVEVELRPLTKEDLVIHEWGVFTIFTDAKHANSNRAAEWASLPAEFYRQFPQERLRWDPAGWDKPIVYFYAKPESLQVQLQVTFPEGAPVVWWPAASLPYDDGVRTKVQRSKPGAPFRSLTWDLWLGDHPPSTLGTSLFARRAGAEEPNPAEFPLPKGCWLEQARLPSATLVTTAGSHIQRSAPWVTTRRESERFVYYDGLVPTPDTLRCQAVDATSITLENRSREAISRVFVIDRRQPQQVRFYDSGPEAAGAWKAGESRQAKLDLAPANWPASGRERLQSALLAAGLFAPEAQALLEIYEQTFFAAEGITALHLLPQSEYDRMLPLEIHPRPVLMPVRVGIAHHPHLEVVPDLAAQITRLIQRLDAEDFAVREAASKSLLGIGPLAVRMLNEARAKTDSAEVRKRIDQVLEQVDASQWLAPQGLSKAQEGKTGG